MGLDELACMQSLSKECHCRPTVTVSPTVQKVLRWSLVKGLLPAAAIVCVLSLRSAPHTAVELCCIGDTDGWPCVCVWLALLAVWLLYAPGTPMCLNVGFIRV